MSARLLIGDVRDRLAEIPDGSVDLIVTSPPFLALRSYLPGDHEHKHREIGSEATPAAFLDTLLKLSAEWRRVLAPHGSMCVELGDTYSGSGGSGGDYNDGGLREGQAKFSGSWSRNGKGLAHATKDRYASSDKRPGWPLAKSLCGIPTLYPWSLAYGRNLLTGAESPAGRWRIRNVIVWARPNPPPGALADKFRPATSYITVACTGAKRWFDLDAVRTEHTVSPETMSGNGYTKGNPAGNGRTTAMPGNPAGAPPLDWCQDMPDEDGDWLWRLATQPYPGSHYATYPERLPKRLIEAMCPRRVCTVCGKPSERVVERERITDGNYNRPHAKARSETNGATFASNGATYRTTLGWTDCGCSADGTHWRPGVVLDAFAGSGTTLAIASGLGRDAIGIDLDERNEHLVRERCGMFLEVGR
jgi:site-specific DNA-methyltransferase (cytosine-N4-specific)